MNVLRPHNAVKGYPIGRVAALTGLPIDVIRVWERRYGLLRPTRSEGGHRHYSDEDIALLRRAAALRLSGLSAATACAQALREVAQEPDEEGSATPSSTPAADSLVKRLYTAALALDSLRASAVLSEAAALLDIETLWHSVLAPTLRRLGADWERGIISPAAEHLLTSIVRGRLSALLEVLPRLPNAPTAIVGAGPGEPHDLSPLFFTLLLMRAGWNVAFLGANTPTEAIIEAVQTVRPRIVVLTATLRQHAKATLETLQDVQKEQTTPMPVLAYGGPGFWGLDGDGDATLMRLDNDLIRALRQVTALA